MIETAMTDDHAHRHRVAQPDVVEHVAADLVADDERDERDLAAGQLVGGRLGPEGVAEQQDHAAQDRRASGSAGRRAASTRRRVAPMFSAASRHSGFRPSMAGAMIRTMSGNWK